MPGARKRNLSIGSIPVCLSVHLNYTEKHCGLQEKKAIESDGQPPSTPNADEKVQSLTAMLLQRQSMLEAAVTEKNSMALQLEREKASLSP